MLRIAIFASGSGSNAENIIRYFQHNCQIEVACVVSNKADAFVLERARGLGVPSAVFDRKAFGEGAPVLDYLRSQNIDLVVLAGFLLLVPDRIISTYPQRIINIHPALLPKYGGKGMYGDYVHQAVVDNKEKESGITIHFIDEVYDRGEIIFQARCPVLPGDTPSDVATKVHSLEYTHFPVIIEQVALGLIRNSYSR